MANLLVSLIMVAVILTVVQAFTRSSLGPQDTLAASTRVMRARTGQIARTELASRGVTVQDAGTTINYTIANTGQTPLRALDEWDVLISYHETAGNLGLQLQRLTYTESATPANGEWTSGGIYLDASLNDAEVFNTGIIDFGEEIVITAKVTPAIGTDTDNLITVSVQNGVTLSTNFSN
ncbi:MAG: hypothetical protein IIB27_04800 [Chloroflexi bacterium]|nr:hypothetical protein [Chloroflexota bacterium]MCH7642074.1 hypothetical protein [Chloroflexota bacterium]